MNQSQKYIIGLTGGIATGKSTVAQYLNEQYSLPIFDADIIARQAVELNSPILQRIVDRYGNQILHPDGSLNRAKLGQIIFHDAQEKQWLEKQIHPFVYDYFQDVINRVNDPIIVFVIPLLFEANMTDLVTEIWVVYCSLEQQIARLLCRNNLTLEEAQRRINSQIPLTEKLPQADVVINNQGDLQKLYVQIDRIMSRQFKIIN
jgi:dephospho-CoA kinase